MSSKKKSSKAKSKRKLTSSQTPKHSKLSMAIQDPAESIESSTALDLSTIAHSQQELSSASQAFKITSTPEANDSKELPEDQESQLLEGSELLVPEQVNDDSTTPEANDSKEQLEAQKEPESKVQNTGGLKAKDESLDLQSSKEDIASYLSQDKPVTHDELVDVGSEDSALSSIQDSELEVGSMTSLFAGSGLLMDFGSESVESKAATSLTKSACSKGSKCPADASQELEHEAEQGSLLVDGYIVGQGGLFDALEEENEPKLPSHPSNFDEFSDVLAPSENLPEVLLSEAEESPYSILEPALDFFGGSSSESSYSEESDPYASLDGNSLYNPKLVSPASAGAGAPMYIDTPNMQDKEPSLKVPKVLKCEHLEYGQSELDLAKDNLTAKPEIGHIEAAMGQKSKQINDEGSIEDVETMADESKPKRKRASTKKVVFDPFIYPIDPKVNVVCGIDEAGRGPLMGDVVAACVILDHEHMIPGLNDSKKLTEKARDALVPVIKEQAIAWGIGRASPQEIDELNILNATFLAMRRAYDAMHKSCNLGLVDGNKIPKTFSDLPVVLEAVVKGDARVPEISAASILAKTARDADLYELDKLYPEYGFAHHKGYPTKDHLAVLQHLPILPCYRLSYGPIKKLLSNNPDYHEAISDNVAHRMQEINQRQQAKLQAQEHEISLVSIDDFEH